MAAPQDGTLKQRDGTFKRVDGSIIDLVGHQIRAPHRSQGILPDDHPLRVGLFTGGAAEAPTVAQADLIVLAGLDPVELILQPWAYAAPVLDLGQVRHDPHYVAPTAALRFLST